MSSILVTLWKDHSTLLHAGQHSLSVKEEVKVEGEGCQVEEEGNDGV